jgi:hypothetical protein
MMVVFESLHASPPKALNLFYLSRILHCYGTREGLEVECINGLSKTKPCKWILVTCREANSRYSFEEDLPFEGYIHCLAFSTKECVDIFN